MEASLWQLPSVVAFRCVRRGTESAAARWSLICFPARWLSSWRFCQFKNIFIDLLIFSFLSLPVLKYNKLTRTFMRSCRKRWGLRCKELKAGVPSRLETLIRHLDEPQLM